MIIMMIIMMMMIMTMIMMVSGIRPHANMSYSCNTCRVPSIPGGLPRTLIMIIIR